MITVCMATYNGGKYIKEQLDSILRQLSSEDEVVISDDGSTDDTLDIIASYNDNRIRVYKHTKCPDYSRVGEIVCDNFANALQYAKGDYIFLSDQDDIWCDNKVETMLKYLPHYGVVASNAWLYSGDINSCEKKLYDRKKPLRNYTLRRGKYYGCVMAFRKSTLKYTLPVPKHMALHDSWFGLVPELVDGAYFIEEPLIYYRYRDDSVSHDKKNATTLLYKIEYRINFFADVYYRVIKTLLKRLAK